MIINVEQFSITMQINNLHPLAKFLVIFSAEMVVWGGADLTQRTVSSHFATESISTLLDSIVKRYSAAFGFFKRVADPYPGVLVGSGASGV